LKDETSLEGRNDAGMYFSRFKAFSSLASFSSGVPILIWSGSDCSEKDHQEYEGVLKCKQKTILINNLVKTQDWFC
jgi:hypothetical protein